MPAANTIDPAYILQIDTAISANPRVRRSQWWSHLSTRVLPPIILVNTPTNALVDLTDTPDAPLAVDLGSQPEQGNLCAISKFLF